MAHTVVRLPAEQIAPLARLYDEAVAARRRHSLIAAAVVAVCIALSCWWGEVKPAVFAANAFRLGDYFWNIVPTLRFDQLGTDLAEWYWNLDGWLKLLADTILIAYLGTVFGAIGGFCLCFLASANLWCKSPFIRLAARRLPGILPHRARAGVRPACSWSPSGSARMPGVLALAIHTMGALGKLFAEVVENIDMKPVEGATASGASWLHHRTASPWCRRCSPTSPPTACLRFEINVREASIMGFVGAGGIGQDLVEAIRKFYYSDVSAILLLIIAAVMIIDLVTEQHAPPPASASEAQPMSRARHRHLRSGRCSARALQAAPSAASSRRRPARAVRTGGWLIAGKHRAASPPIGFWQLGFSLSAGWAPGIAQLAPLRHADDAARSRHGSCRSILHALGETLAIAFLGTLGGARCIAFPFGLPRGEERHSQSIVRPFCRAPRC